MKILALYLAVMAAVLSGAAMVRRSAMSKICWCWPPVSHTGPHAKPKTVTTEYVAYGSYGTEADWNNPERIYQLNFNQDQGRRIFYQHCVWCHADATPAGPSNRSNVTPEPPLMNDPAALAKVSDGSLRNMIAHGGRAVGKSAMMPPYGDTLTAEEIDDVIAYIRVVAAPEPVKPAGNAKSNGE
ncbi:cytochrome c [Acidobacteria bacterium AB60]|nr:cytochrome c [Acidobacteria bacterium AB60]